MLLEFLLAAALSQTPAQDSIRDFTIRRMDFVLFHQEIDPENVSRLSHILGEGEILDVQSPGGDIWATIDMARLVRERRARVRTTAECSSGCAIVWVTARERMVDGFTAITFHGNPISSLAWMRANPGTMRDEEIRFAESSAAALTAVLDEARIQPWLFLWANRLQNQVHTVRPDLTLPTSERFTSTEDYHLVWFPRSILEAAGVRHLDSYDEPNARQRQAIETEQGTRRVPKRIYWAKDGDCDIDREASAG